jgi:hypothetical protein
MIERVFTTINKESISHKHYFAGVPTIFRRKTRPGLQIHKMVSTQASQTTLRDSLAKLPYGPSVIIANVYGRTSGCEDSKASLFNKLN